MARSMFADSEIFRAVLEYHFKDGSTFIGYKGPFTAKAPATAVINEEKHVVAYRNNHGWGWNSPYTLVAYVEKCSPVWEKV